MKTLLTAVLVGISAASGMAAEAKITLRCYSISMNPTTMIHPTLGTVTHYYTTADGRTDRFPLHEKIGNLIAFSSECRPIGSARSQSYETDNIILRQSDNTFIQYGRLTFDFNSPDADNDGFPDFFQKERAADFTASGSFTADYPQVAKANVTGKFSRKAGQVAGSYAITSAATGNTLNGTWSILELTGTIRYDQILPSASMDLVTVRYDASVGLFEGSTKFQVVSADNVRLSDIVIRRSDGPTIKGNQNPVVLSRNGGQFIGELTLVDGASESSWADYIHWQIVVLDTNDSDGDGIPDVSDTVFKNPSLKRISKGANGAVTFDIVGQVGEEYSIFSTSDFKRWNLHSHIQLTTPTKTIADDQKNPQQFYKIQ